MATATQKSFTSPKGRVSYPSVYRTTKFGDGDPYYAITLIFDEDTDLSGMEKAITECAMNKWGKVPPKMVSPLVDCSEKADTPGYDHGGKFVHFKNSVNRPAVVDQRMAPIAEEDGKFYAGCYARVSYRPFAWEYESRKGVSLSLCNVQKVAEGEPFGAQATDPNDEFGPVDDDDLF